MIKLINQIINIIILKPLTEPRLHVIDNGTNSEEVRGLEREEVTENYFAEWVFGKSVVQFGYVTQRHYKLRWQLEFN